MNKIASIISCSIVASVYAYFSIISDSRNYQQPIFSVDLKDGDVKNVETLSSPVTEPRTVATDLKFKINNFYSYRLESIDAHLKSNERFFDEEFYDSFRKKIKSRAESLLQKDVRVADFIITEGPIYIGSKMSGKKNWTFYISGFISYDGLFSKDSGASFIPKQLFVEVEESESMNGNPSGVKITSITE